MFRQAVIAQSDELTDLKGSFIRSFGEEKKKLLKEIKKREEQLGDQLPVHSPIGSVDWRIAFAEVFRKGGFDIALENPPYVRMELFKTSKPTLKSRYPLVYDGAADLYVYFFARTFQILRPGGTACFITPNKWLKTGYGEPLRRFLSKSTWVASVVDFGHAKQIFQEADVFPAILVLRKPDNNIPPSKAYVCAIPRDRLKLDDLANQVFSEGHFLPRGRLSADSWTLEPPAVFTLIDKQHTRGVPLKKFINAGPLYGVKTGCNEAFLVDTATKEALVKADPKSKRLFKPYLRGQDLNRWQAQWAGQWMITLKSSNNIEWPWSKSGKQAESIFKATYPAIYEHSQQYRDQLIDRKNQVRFWWELSGSSQWEFFEQPKIMYQDITWGPCFCSDTTGMMANNTIYFLPTIDSWVLAALNSPNSWWLAWRGAQHCKDEGLRFFTEFMEEFPIPDPTAEQCKSAGASVKRLIEIAAHTTETCRSILKMMIEQFAIEKPSQKLQNPAVLSEDAFIAEVQKLRGKRQILSAVQVKALRDEHAKHVRPLQLLAAEAMHLEVRVADLVNEAYGLTPDDVALMWKTAPPRMPGEPPK